MAEESGSASSLEVERLRHLSENYLAQQRTSARFALFSNIGAAILIATIVAGVVFAWEYYKDSVQAVQDTRLAAVEARKNIDELLKQVETTKQELAALRADLSKSPTVVRTVDDPSNKRSSQAGLFNVLLDSFS